MTGHPPHDKAPARQVIAASATFAAGALLFVTALLTLFQGIAAALGSSVINEKQDYTYELNTTGWGVIHVLMAILLGAVAIGLILGATWARLTAILMSSLSIVSMFLWLPYYPVWSLVVIALDIIVVWAVATWEPR